MARYIDADEAIKVIKEMVDNCDSRFYGEALIDAQSEILALPTADVAEVKHAHWKEIVEKGNCFEHTYYICTNCGVVALDEDYECHCHHCGAKMDGGKAE